jgi:hypothetical protein
LSNQIKSEPKPSSEGLIEVNASKRPWIACALAILGFAIAARVALNFSHKYAPATDAAYYPMQTRAWITRGHFVYDDLPLIFWLDAGLAKVLVAAGQPLDAAVMTSTRVVDCVTEPFVALFVMAMGYVWSSGNRRALVGTAAAAMLAVLSPPIVNMVSNFQKNSLGLVWMSAAIWACREAMLRSNSKRWVRLCVILGLSALTHIGAFAVTVLIVAISLLAWRPKLWPRFAMAAIPIIALLYLFEPRRARALLGGGQLWQWPHQDAPVLAWLVMVVIVAFTINWLRRDYKDLAAGDFAIVCALIVATVFLVQGKNVEYFGRLFIMAPVPAGFLIAFIFSRLERAGFSLLPAWIVLALIIGVAALESPRQVQGAYISAELEAELRQFKQRAGDLTSTVIVAQHGVEWWAGYVLDMPVRGRVSDDAFDRYRHVVSLRLTGKFGTPDMVPPFRPHRPDPSFTRLYAGEYVEFYEMPRPRQ